MYNKVYNPFGLKVLMKWSKTMRWNRINFCYKGSFKLMLPPPNITGWLHIGHALSLSIQSVFFWKFSCEYKFLWYKIGLDHAGIATKYIILKRYGGVCNRKFWAWKRQICKQLIFQINKFTHHNHLQFDFSLNKNFVRATSLCFVKFFKRNLVMFRTRYMNFDTLVNVPLSELEIVKRVCYTKLNTVCFIIVCGNRFEFVGKTWTFTNILRCNISFSKLKALRALFIGINVFTVCRFSFNWVLNPVSFKKVNLIVNFLESDVKPIYKFCRFDTSLNINIMCYFNFIVSLVDLLHTIFLSTYVYVLIYCYFSERTGLITNLVLSKQWFISYSKLCSNKNFFKTLVTFPSKWKTIMYSFSKDLNFWCVSRSLFWGHRLPVWYYGIFFSVRDSLLKAVYYLILSSLCLFKDLSFEKFRIGIYTKRVVFDTWFSSSLWPLATLAWPNMSKFYRLFSRVGLVLTGFDIVLSWVFRMMLVCFFLTGFLPFRFVVIHPIVYDKFGRKMSKTKGNVVTINTLSNVYGSDVVNLYFTLINLDSQEFKFSLNDFISARNLCTKFWNVGLITCFEDCNFLCSWIVSCVFFRLKPLNYNLFKFKLSMYFKILRNIIKYDFDNYFYLLKLFNLKCCSCFIFVYNYILYKYSSSLNWGQSKLLMKWIFSFNKVLLNKFGILIRFVYLLLPFTNVVTNSARALYVLTEFGCVLINLILLQKLKLSSSYRILLVFNMLIMVS